jgi:hypothetical protein
MRFVNKINNLPSHILSALSLGKADFFCSLDWFDNFIKTVAEVDGLDVKYIYMNDKFNILIPAVVFRDGVFRKIKSLSNYYSPIFTIFFSDKLPNSTDVVHFFIGLKDSKYWDVMDLKPLSNEESNYIKICADRAGLFAFRYHCFANWYLNINNRFYSDYYLSLPSRLRNIIKRKSKKYFEIEGARIDIVTTEQEFHQGLAAYHEVYEASWKVLEPYPDFMSGLIRLGISNGMGRLGIAYIGSKAVAVQYWIVSNNTAYIYKLAYDEAYKKQSVGTVLTAKMMEFVIDIDKVNIVDFLTGDDKYKEDWMNNKQDRYGVILFNPTTLFGLVGGIGETLKKYVKFFKKYTLA